MCMKNLVKQYFLFCHVVRNKFQRCREVWNCMYLGYDIKNGDKYAKIYFSQRC